MAVMNTTTTTTISTIVIAKNWNSLTAFSERVPF
jgi:hypothetical protein